MPNARGELGLLFVGDSRAGLRGGGSRVVSTGVTMGRIRRCLSEPAEVGRTESTAPGTIDRVLGSYVPGFRWGRDCCEGADGTACFGFSRGVDVNVRVLGS